MTKTHEGRVAAVTGSAKGIGRAVAIELAKRGAALVLLDIEEADETAGLVRAEGAETLVLRTDVTSEADWTKAAEAIDRKFGRLDILVNNAGIYPFTHFDVMDYDVWSRVLRINLDGTFLGTKALVPLMKKNRWGRIVSMSSASMSMETPGFAHYTASKMGIIGFTRGVANDLGQYGITVNTIAPTVTDTPGTSITPDEVKKTTWTRQPIARFAQPEDIVGPIMFFTSDDAAFVTGQTLVVDGGLTKN